MLRESLNLSPNRLLNYFVIFYAFAISTSRAAIVLLTFILLFLWIKEGKISEKVDILRNSKIIKVLLLFVLYSFFSILWSENKLIGLDYVLKYWYFMPIAIIFTSVQKEYIKYIFSAFLLGMLLNEFLSYSIWLELISWKNRTTIDPTPFMNHLQYSLFLAFTSLLILLTIFDERNIRLRIFYIFYFLSVTINLFINGGRTGQVAFLFSLFILFFISIKNKIIAFTVSILFILFILIAGSNYIQNFKDRVEALKSDIVCLIDNKNYNTSIGQRIGMWQVAYEIISENKLFGTGVGDEISVLYDKINQKHQDKICIIVNGLPHYHNDVVQIIVQLGILGGFLFLLLFYFILCLDIKDVYMKRLSIIFVFVYFISSQFEVMFHAQFSMAMFALFVGIFLAFTRIENEYSC